MDSLKFHGSAVTIDRDVPDNTIDIYLIKIGSVVGNINVKIGKEMVITHLERLKGDGDDKKD